MVVNGSKSEGILINRIGNMAIYIVVMLFVGCAHNIAVLSTSNPLATYADKIDTASLLIIPESLSSYSYEGTGSTPEVLWLPLDKWTFQLGQPTSDLLRKGLPLIFKKVEIAAEIPTGNDLRNAIFKLIIKPSIESFDFGWGSSFGWVKIKYKVEVLDLNSRVIFCKVVTGKGESPSKPLDFGGKTTFAKAADCAVQNGVNLLLDSLYNSKEVRDFRE